MNKRTKLILILTPIGCIILGLIIWACLRSQNQNLSKTTDEYMSFEPMPSDGSTLITYSTSIYNSTASSKQYRNRLHDVYDMYATISRTASYGMYKKCEQGVPPKPGSNEVCLFDVRNLGRCVPEWYFGYDGRGSPCIFLKFKTFSDWLPQYYNSSDLPSGMPDHLKKNITEIEEKYGGDSNKLKTVWVNCEGKNAADKEAIGPLQYSHNGFDGAFFPAVNKEEYLSPLVAVQFLRPQFGTVIFVQCKAWAKNINHKKGEGIVNFQLKIT